MTTTDDTIDALAETDRFVRLMAVASGTSEIVYVVRAYLASWSRERVIRLQKTDAGWAPFDEFQQPFSIVSVEDVRQIAGSVRIRCRELNASDERIAPDLLELDTFFFFANESLLVHEPTHVHASVRSAAPQHGAQRQSAREHGQEARM